MTPRDCLKKILSELPAVRSALLIRAQMPAVCILDDWQRMCEHAVGQRSTAEVPIAPDDDDD